MTDPAPENDFEDVRELIQFLKENAEELRSKGVPVDDMIRDLERQMEVVRAAKEKERDAHARLKEFERERADRRREVDAIAARLPPDLLDGMSSTKYLAGIAERQAERRRRGRGRVGQ